MVVTLLGIVIADRFSHPENTPSSMVVIPLGNVAVVKLLQLEYLQLIVFQIVLIKTVEK